MADLDTQMIRAARVGDLNGVKAALAAGADIHAQDDYALQWAASRGHLDVVEYLLAAGSDIHANEDFALRWAVEHSQTEVVACLLAAGADPHAEKDSPLRMAAGDGCLPIVECLLAAGANVHAEDGLALYWAAARGHALVVKRLLDAGAYLTPTLAELPQHSQAVQVTLLTHGNVTGLVVTNLARRGVCPEALCVLLARQGQTELAAMIQATEMLTSLTPAGRAVLLEDLLQNPHKPESPHVGP